VSALIALVPALPLASAAALMIAGEHLSRRAAGTLGVGSVGLAALLVALGASAWLAGDGAREVVLWTWLAVGDFAPRIAFQVDGLTVVMMAVITGVGFFIHLYSLEFMDEDDGFTRYFACMNLFVGAMLLLVMADNLLLLYLGWEGVGMCSYLLIGFWYRDPANGAAARKAFLVTRVGDVFMALGLLLLFTELGTLDIERVVELAQAQWRPGDTLPVLAAALLLGGALGKSAQLPLHSWLPDAMAGPTPVSALIHAATMVTAGVYLIARLHGLYELAPAVLQTVAWIGLATALFAALTALTQRDIKRILAYSTLSQIGLMFLAAGVGAYAAAVLHLVSHAFFKALLFLAAGAVTHCLHHEHDIFRMGGLARRLPIPFAAFLVGTAALSALPPTAGYYSKDAIFTAAWDAGGTGPLLWLGGVVGAFLTSVYSFRLLFIAFFGPAQTQPDRRPGWRMALPLLVLGAAALAGGAIALPLAGALPLPERPGMPLLAGFIGGLLPLLGVALAYALFLGRQLSLAAYTDSPRGRALQDFLFSGWRIDALYARLFVRPYEALAGALRGEPVDRLVALVVAANRTAHRAFASLQTGELRWYTTTFAVGIVLLLALVLRSPA
jgi:NADH-quinone oxidoreductase subunit L